MTDHRQMFPASFNQHEALRPANGAGLYLHAFRPATRYTRANTVFCVCVDAISESLNEAGEPISITYLARHWPWNDPAKNDWCYDTFDKGTKYRLVINYPSECQPPNGPIIKSWGGQ